MRDGRILVGALALLAACGQSYSASEDPDASTPMMNGGAPNIVVTPTDFDFGQVPCGTDAPGKVLTIRNTGNAAAPYKIVIPDGSAFRIDGAATGTLEAGAVATFKILAKPGAAGQNASDLLVTAGAGMQPIHATISGTGAQLEVLPPIVDFGDARMQSGAAKDVQIHNLGNVPIALSSFSASNDFTVTADTTPLPIAAGATAFVHAQLKPGTMPSGLLQDVVKVTTSQPVCGLPPAIALKGRRVNSNVTFTSGDFGKVNCTPQPAARDVIISNYANAVLSYTSSLAAGSKFAIVAGDSGAITAGTATTPATATIKVQPKAFGTTVGTLQEDLTVVISGVAAPDGGPRKLPLVVDVRGAILTLSATTLSFSAIAGSPDMKSFNAQNTGNEILYLQWGFQRASGTSNQWQLTTPSSLTVSQTRTVSVTFTAAEGGTSSDGTLTPTRTTDFFGVGGVLCGVTSPVALHGVSN